MQIGMIGLGRMGANMARRLIRKGHTCVVFNRLRDNSWGTSLFSRDIDGVVFRLIAGESDVLPSSAVWSADSVNPAIGHFMRLTEGIANKIARTSAGAKRTL